LPTHKKFVDQFHQQIKIKISSVNWCTSCQFCSLFAKRHLPKKTSLLEKASKNVGEVSISSTFYVNFFEQKCFAQLFSTFHLA